VIKGCDNFRPMRTEPDRCKNENCGELRRHHPQFRRRPPATNSELRAVLTTVATILEAKRDRLGRLDFAHTDSEAPRQAREVLRLYAVKYDVGGCADVMEQCAKVIREVLEFDK
jgi:hypothetical protein